MHIQLNNKKICLFCKVYLLLINCRLNPCNIHTSHTSSPSPHLEQFVFLASPLVPLVNDAPPQDPGVLLQVREIG